MQTPEEFTAKNPKSHYSRKEAEDLLREYASQQDELILDLFEQSCSTATDKEGNVLYDHECISTFENAQEYLLDRGIIKPQQCYRP